MKIPRTAGPKSLNVKRDEDGRVVAFTIDRKYHGKGRNGGNLLNRDGLMCCLGHYSRACKVKSADILDKAYPSSVKKIPQEMEWLVHNTSTFGKTASDDAVYLADANDFEYQRETATNRAARERKIIRRFAKRGIEVSFIGEPND